MISIHFEHYIFTFFFSGGGFIAPFQEMCGKGPAGAFDFRLPNVLMILASGHKFAEQDKGLSFVSMKTLPNTLLLPLGT